MAVNKNKMVCCMYTRVTSRDDLEDMLAELRKDIEDDLKLGSVELKLQVYQ